MKIVVCIKQVPDTTEVRLNPETGTLMREGVPSIINPDDKSGLELALELKDEYGEDAEVIVITMGPQQADIALKEALAMGADRAILLTDRAFAGSDTWSTSITLAAAIRKLDYDLIIAGRQAIDGDTAQVGPQIAEHLRLPQVTYVQDLEVEQDSIVVQRMFEDGYQKIRVKLPCLITTLKEAREARYMSIGGVFDAFSDNKVEVWGLDDIEVEKSELGLKGSPTKVRRSFTKGARAAGKVFETDTAEAVDIIIDKLKEKFIL